MNLDVVGRKAVQRGIDHKSGRRLPEMSMETLNIPEDIRERSVAGWPAWLCLAGYLIFFIGFWPWALLSRFDLHPNDVADTGLRVAITLLLGLGPCVAFFRPIGKILGGIVETLFWLLFAGTLIIALLAMVFGTTASSLIALMCCGGLTALAVLISSALRHGGARNRPITWIACAVLITLGGWSIISGVVMARQAEQLAQGRPYHILLRGHPNQRIAAPGWWVLRGSAVLGPNNEGNEHPYFHFHATLDTGWGHPTYTWSKRAMRFDPVRR